MALALSNLPESHLLRKHAEPHWQHVLKNGAPLEAPGVAVALDVDAETGEISPQPSPPLLVFGEQRGGSAN